MPRSNRSRVKSATSDTKLRSPAPAGSGRKRPKSNMYREDADSTSGSEDITRSPSSNKSRLRSRRPRASLAITTTVPSGSAKEIVSTAQRVRAAAHFRTDGNGESSLPAFRSGQASAMQHQVAGKVFPEVVTSRPRGWRQSLLQPNTERIDRRRKELQKRFDLVRSPAVAALESLIEIGKGVEDDYESEGDEGGGGFGLRMKMTDTRARYYLAFKAAKEAYLSQETFLSPLNLPSSIPHPPPESFISLIKLSNLTTFLFLVLSSNPTEWKITHFNVERENLQQALQGLQDDVMPAFFEYEAEDETGNSEVLNEGTIKLIVDLTCQLCLFILGDRKHQSAAASRSAPLIATYLQQPFSSYFPTPRRGLRSQQYFLAYRNLKRRYEKLCENAIAKIESVGEHDVEVLQVAFGPWEDVARRARYWVETLAARLAVVYEGLDEGGDVRAASGELRTLTRSESEGVGFSEQEERQKAEASEENLEFTGRKYTTVHYNDTNEEEHGDGEVYQRRPDYDDDSESDASEIVAKSLGAKSSPAPRLTASQSSVADEDRSADSEADDLVADNNDQITIEESTISLTNFEADVEMQIGLDGEEDQEQHGDDEEESTIIDQILVQESTLISNTWNDVENPRELNEAENVEQRVEAGAIDDTTSSFVLANPQLREFINQLQIVEKGSSRSARTGEKSMLKWRQQLEKKLERLLDSQRSSAASDPYLKFLNLRRKKIEKELAVEASSPEVHDNLLKMQRLLRSQITSRTHLLQGLTEDTANDREDLNSRATEDSRRSVAQSRNQADFEVNTQAPNNADLLSALLPELEEEEQDTQMNPFDTGSRKSASPEPISRAAELTALEADFDDADDSEENDLDEEEENLILIDGTQLPNRAEELAQLTASESEEEQEEDSAPLLALADITPMPSRVQREREPAPGPSSSLRPPQSSNVMDASMDQVGRKERATRLQFQPDLTLKRVPDNARRNKYLDKQTDAERITFDSQMEDAVIALPQAAKKRGPTKATKKKKERTAKKVKGQAAGSASKKYQVAALSRGQATGSANEDDGEHNLGDSNEADDVDKLDDDIAPETHHNNQELVYDDFGGGELDLERTWMNQESRREGIDSTGIPDEGPEHFRVELDENDGNTIEKKPATKRRLGKGKGRERTPLSVINRGTPSNFSSPEGSPNTIAAAMVQQLAAREAIAHSAAASEKRTKFAEVAREDEDGFETQSDESDAEEILRNRKRSRHSTTVTSSQARQHLAYQPAASTSVGDHILDLHEGAKPSGSARHPNKNVTAREEVEDSDDTDEMSQKDELSSDSEQDTGRRDQAASRARLKRRKRLWTRKEDECFEALLELGFSYAKIIKLHGANGELSRTLRHRDNAALKDRARNLKAIYLNLGADVPSYLAHVSLPLRLATAQQQKKQQQQQATPELSGENSE